MPRNSNAYGPLTDGRDFTFVDGRPTPVNSGQRRRLEQNKLHAVGDLLNFSLNEQSQNTYFIHRIKLFKL
jgi:hypothetical protein